MLGEDVWVGAYCRSGKDPNPRLNLGRLWGAELFAKAVGWVHLLGPSRSVSLWFAI